ncbi:hypothetical protein [Wohlfahrtiimonas larvae]|uniref:Uncharacterized protein n=1 Tax=Wohlfahrtiimonas larvae TaxID=1157986 RepID=A0ABP9MS92_9GAMM|nr:hypothetical protein [Wohlfahrtiimonas larvae]
MKVDAIEFPIVRVDYVKGPNENIEDTLSDLSDLLKRQQPFVFVGEGVPQEENKNLEERKKVALWMKANHEDVQKWIKGHVHVVKEADKFEMMQEFSIIFKKFWGYPMIVVRTSEEALSEAALLLKPE